MARIILLFSFFALSQISILAQAIIPQPVAVQHKEGVFRLSAKTILGAQSPECQKVASLFSEKFAQASGIKLNIKEKGNIQFSLNATPNSILGNEGYEINATSKIVTLKANTEAGLFYALQTLYQLMPTAIESSVLVQADWTIKNTQITDYPRFAWRGMMLDVSRHFFQKQDVKRFIDDMVRYKYNVFHWHLTDDEGWRIEIKSLPKLTEVGACRTKRHGKWGNHTKPTKGEATTDCGFYTQDDIREIVRYAAERHIQILPEVDVPGHSSAAIAAYPELCCTKDSSMMVSPGHKFAEWFDNGTFKLLQDNALNPSDSKTYDFLDKVFTEVAALFPFKYIHAGGDECYKGYWEENAACKALMQQENIKNGHELQSYFTKRVEKIIQSKGKKLIGWDEILEGGLAPDAAVMSWRGAEGGIAAAKEGHYAVMSPNDFCYIDLIQGDKQAEPDATSYKTVRLKTAYDYEPLPEGIDAKYILGGQTNLWTEKIPTIRHAEYMSFPRAWALADVFWSPKNTKNWEGFIPRMEAHFERADQAGMNYARSVYDAFAKANITDNQLITTLETEIKDLDIYYTLDETDPDIFTLKYTAPIVIPEGNNVTLRVATYRGNKRVGKVINYPREVLLKRVKK